MFNRLRYRLARAAFSALAGKRLGVPPPQPDSSPPSQKSYSALTRTNTSPRSTCRGMRTSSLLPWTMGCRRHSAGNGPSRRVTSTACATSWSTSGPGHASPTKARIRNRTDRSSGGFRPGPTQPWGRRAARAPMGSARASQPRDTITSCWRNSPGSSPAYTSIHQRPCSSATRLLVSCLT